MPDKRIEKRTEQFKNAGGNAAQKLISRIAELKESKADIDSVTADQLMKLYEDIALEFKQRYDGRTEAPEYKKMAKTFSKDYIALKHYKNNLDKGGDMQGIEEFYENSRTRTVEIPFGDISLLGTAGAGQNTRYKVSFKVKDEDVAMAKEGDIVTGFFTENGKIGSNDPEESYAEKKKDIVAELVKKYPAQEKLLRSTADDADGIYSTDLGKCLRNYPSVFGTKYSVKETKKLFSRCYDDTYKENAGKYKKALDDIKTDADLMAFTELHNSLYKARLGTRLRAKQGITEAAAHGKRNALTSAFAELLGCGDVVAYSEKMNIKTVENGKEVIKKGVMMMPAKGMDPDSAKCSSPYTKFNKASVEQSPGLIKNIASLQVLDYIINNNDRHPSNYFLDLDENGKLRSIQGIDNDSTFGAEIRAFLINYGVKPSDFRVIPQSMADAISELNPDTLEILMQGYDLSQKEMDAVKTKVTDFQQKLAAFKEAYKNVTDEKYIDPKVPRIVPDEKLDQYYVNAQLAFTDPKGKNRNHSNLFGKLTVGNTKLSNINMAITNDFRAASSAALSVRSDRYDRSRGSLYAAVSSLKKQSTDDNSPEYRNMVESIKALYSKKYDGMKLVEKSSDWNLSETGGAVIYRVGGDFSSYEKAVTKAYKASCEYLAANAGAAEKYQNLKADIEMYRQEKDTENLKKAEEALREAESDPEFIRYRTALKCREKLAGTLNDLEKIEDRVYDMQQGKKMFDRLKKDVKNGDAYAEDYSMSLLSVKAREDVSYMKLHQESKMQKVNGINNIEPVPEKDNNAVIKTNKKL